MKNKKLFFGSSYDRGLDILLFIWPDILEQVPDATLEICYGWNTFDSVTANNPERVEWKKHIEMAMQQPGITHHGRVGKEELTKIRKECGIWAYPTYFEEINCITALEAQRDGLVPVTMTLAALSETAKEGILVEGDIKDPEVLEKYKTALISLMKDSKKHEELSKKCQEFASNYSWESTALKWTESFIGQDYSDTKVTVFTPTVREGFWNVMAHNLSEQTHKNFEWIIVDDYKKNREKIAQKYASKYDLDIKYLRGKEHKKRTYSLINANNTAIQNATGELFVFLQDFVLIQPNALYELIRESKRHPGDFIAPVDVYYAPKIKPDTKNKEDWFNGETDVLGTFMRSNTRIVGQGLRKSKVVTDFEQNFGAVPLKTLKMLGGYYEFFDEALGWDDTEIIYRAMKLGIKLWIDEWNIATCIDHWGVLGKDEGGTSVNRTRRLNDPRFVWMIEQIEKGKLPIIRTQKVDDQIDLQYEIPQEIDDEHAVDWMKQNIKNITEGWS